MNTFKKTTASLMACALSVSAFAVSDLEMRVQELEKKVDMISTTTATGSFGSKTATARPEHNGKGWFLSLDVLYWQTKISNAIYATTNSNNINSPVTIVGSAREPSFSWDFGVKAGIGYNFCHDGWDVYAEFTYLNNNANDRVSVASPAAVLPFNAPLFITAPSKAAILQNTMADFALDGISELEVTLDDLNLELGRDYFVSKYLSFRPHFGLKSTWIKFEQKSRFTGGGTAYTVSVSGVNVAVDGLGSETLYSKFKNSVWGLGPRAGVNSRWHIGEGFSFYGDASASLLFTYLENRYRSYYSALPSNLIKAKYKYHALTPNMAFGLGLAYDKYMMEDTQHIHISLGYDNMIFWNLAHLTLYPTNANVGFYGVDLKVRWDF